MLNDWIRGDYRYLTAKTIARSQIQASATVTVGSTSDLIPKHNIASSNLEPVIIEFDTISSLAELLGKGRLAGQADLLSTTSGSLQSPTVFPSGTATPLRSIRLNQSFTRLDEPPAWFFETTPAEATSTVTFDLAGSLLGQGEISGADDVTFSVTDSTLEGKTSLSSSESVSFSTSGNIFSTTGTLTANVTIQIDRSNSFLRATASIGAVSDLTVSALARVSSGSRGIATPITGGFRVYNALQIASFLTVNDAAARVTLVASEPLTFSSSASLTGASEGAIVATSTITTSTAPAQLRATASKSGLLELTISASATPSNAAGSPITASETVTIGSSVDLGGVGNLSASETINVSVDANVSSGPVDGNVTISISSSADARRTAKASTNTSVTFGSSALLLGLAGESISGSAAISTSVTSALGGIFSISSSETVIFRTLVDTGARFGDKPGFARSGKRSIVSGAPRRSIKSSQAA